LISDLKPIIEATLRRGKEALKNESINLVLLSGGSANIEWLRAAIAQDLGADLAGSQILSVGNYQEVVAKGLAIQCAKKFFNERQSEAAPSSDESPEFTATTYNPLSLVVRADDHPPTLARFKSKQIEIASTSRGLLLSSGTDLDRII
jgi:molecular chaperone DnaK (HSP70)